jgi:hypothetical protein
MLKRLLLVAVLGMTALSSAGAPALATGPVTCPPSQTPDPKTGVCVIVVGTAPVGGGGDVGPVAHVGPVGGGVGPQTCVMANGDKVACRDGNSWWNNSLGCYISLASPQPPKSDPIWAGRTDGAIYQCYDPLVGKFGGNPLIALWSATPPAGPAAPPDPRVLAQQAIALMRLRAINIGIVPEPRAGSVGIIGMPTWMWAQNPSLSTWGPVTKSASAGAFTVTATARVDRVVWAMGDGSTVACTGSGTAYQDSFGKTSSPTCGYLYTRQGTYAVRATSYWTVQWAGVGQTGTIPMNFSQTTNITMGEAQVLTQ